MATLTSFKARPYITPRAIVEVELVQAIPEDLKKFSGYDQNGKPIYKLREGLVYWLQSSITGKIEPTPRMITNNSNKGDLKIWLDFKMIWIAKNPFN